MVGFNRRYSPAMAAREALTGTGPLMMRYRVNAGPIAEGHWYNDRRQGGRLLGEVCHFIDTCCALVDDVPVTSVYATTSGQGEALLDPDVSVLLRSEDGSQASIVYASGGYSSTPKERLEVLGRSRTVLVDDFTRVDVDGKPAWSGSQDKGHLALLASFHRSPGSDSNDCARPALAASAAVLAAAASLLESAGPAPEIR